MTDCFAASAAELPELTRLWSACFGDAEAEIAAFWDTLFSGIQVHCLRRGGQLAAMLCAVPTLFLGEDGAEHPAAYLYAACTAPAMRGRGLFRTLMAASERLLADGGFDFAALVPAGEPLFSLYARLGYAPVCTHRAYRLSAAPSALQCERIDARAYRSLRQMQLRGDFLDYDEAFLSWQSQLGARSGAGLYRLETPQALCCAAAVRRADTLWCKELLPDCPAAAAALAQQLGCRSVCVRTPGQAQVFGMMKSLRGKNLPKSAYLGLAFD